MTAADDQREYLLHTLRVSPERAEQIIAETQAGADKARHTVEARILQQASDALIAHCPDHGNQETCFIVCQCLGAEELARWARARGGDQ